MAGALALALAACGGGADGPDPEAPGGALDVEVAGVDGGAPLRLADLGGPAVVNLWATWCVPCRAELPAVDAVDRVVPDGEVRFVGVNIGDPPGAVTAFLDDVGVAFPQYRDAGGRLHGALGATGMPTTVFVDGGVVLDLHAGALSAAELAAEVERRFGVAVALP